MIIGITGRPATGKSSVGKFFAENNGLFIDADSIVHELYLPNNPGAKSIVKHFSSSFLNIDGSVNRQALGLLVFKDQTLLRKLNSLIHPLVYQKILSLIKETPVNKLIVIEAVYLEKLSFLLDYLFEVICDEKIARERAKKKGIDDSIYSLMCKVQVLPEKFDGVIVNNSNLFELEMKVKRILRTMDFLSIKR